MNDRLSVHRAEVPVEQQRGVKAVATLQQSKRMVLVLRVEELFEGAEIHPLESARQCLGARASA